MQQIKYYLYKDNYNISVNPKFATEKYTKKFTTWTFSDTHHPTGCTFQSATPFSNTHNAIRQFQFGPRQIFRESNIPKPASMMQRIEYLEVFILVWQILQQPLQKGL